MYNFELHSTFYNNPVLLNEREKEMPLIVIQDFFDDVKLIEVRMFLYDMLKVALTSSNTIYDEAQSRDMALHFISKLEKLIEATSLL